MAELGGSGSRSEMEVQMMAEAAARDGLMGMVSFRQFLTWLLHEAT